MNSEDKFAAVFAALSEIMRPYGEKLDCTRDDDTEYWLNTRHIMKNKKPLFFGAVQIRKNYVSYHLMPVYVFPALLEDISADLQKRMQGKSCFNFKSTDADLFDELATLTKSGFEAYKRAGYTPEDTGE